MQDALIGRRDKTATSPQEKPANATAGICSNANVLHLFLRGWRLPQCRNDRCSRIWVGGARQPVSRVLCQPRQRRAMAIPLGRPLPDASRDLPGRLARKPAFPPQRERRPYLVLLPVGFTVPSPLPAPRCALTAPFHPHPQASRPWRADCSLWHFPWGRPRRALPGTVFPWSPDFPPPGRPGSGHPAT